MDDLRKSGEDDSRAKVTYAQLCGVLATHVRSLIDYLKMTFVHLEHPESSFSTNDHLVKPWNQLQDALSHKCFLMDAASFTIELEVELQGLLDAFEKTLQENVLRPFAQMFDLGDYSRVLEVKSFRRWRREF